MAAFEHISEPVTRVIYSCADELMARTERAEALKRAKANTRAAYRHEHLLKKRSHDLRSQIIQGAYGGSLKALAAFIKLADEYDEAVLARKACERIERGYQ